MRQNTRLSISDSFNILSLPQASSEAVLLVQTRLTWILFVPRLGMEVWVLDYPTTQQEVVRLLNTLICKTSYWTAFKWCKWWIPLIMPSKRQNNAIDSFCLLTAVIHVVHWNIGTNRQGWSSWLWRGLNTAEVEGSTPSPCIFARCLLNAIIHPFAWIFIPQ